MKLKAKISYFIEVDIATPNYFKTVCVSCTLFHSSYCNCFSLSVYTGFECLPPLQSVCGTYSSDGSHHLNRISKFFTYLHHSQRWCNRTFLFFFCHIILRGVL